MAPTKPSNKTSTSKDSTKQSKTFSSSSSRVSKKKDVKRPAPQQVKPTPLSAASNLKKKQKREYTEAELDLPRLNAITPVGVVKPKGKKKGKTFVDDKVFSFLSFLPFFFLSVFLVAVCLRYIR